jgi:hypothetical protein
MSAIRSGALSLLALLVASAPLRSQCLEWSKEFALPGTNGTVTASVVFDDGTGPALYVAGEFFAAGGILADGIARWDGETWTALGSGVDSIYNVRALAVFDEGSGPALFAAGDFTSIAGVSALHVARWNGTAWSAVGGGTNGFLNALSVFDDGSGPALYAAGGFSSAGGVAASSIAKWNGSSWSQLGSGIQGTVMVLEGFDDGSGPALYAGGGIAAAGGAPASNIARWSGGTWSAVGTGFDFFVNVLETFDAGSGPALYAGGSFGMAGTVVTNRIARWSGSAW